MASGTEKNEEKIADLCASQSWTGALNVLEIRSLLGGDIDSSAVYRALSNDDRFEQVTIPGGSLTLFRLRALSR